MNIDSSIASLQGTVADSKSALDRASTQLQDFEQVLAELDQQRSGGGEVPADVSQTSTEAGGALSPEKVGAPANVERLMEEIESGYERLEQLVAEVQGGRTFSAGELLGVQMEMHQIALNVEMSTRVISEVTSNVRTLLNQQV